MSLTLFDPYIASDPIHNANVLADEWFSAIGTTTATVTYDLGSVFTLDRLALWNEDFTGIGNFNILSSTDGVNFSTILSGVSPIDNPSAMNPHAFRLGSVKTFQTDVKRHLTPHSILIQHISVKLSEHQFQEINH